VIRYRFVYLLSLALSVVAFYAITSISLVIAHLLGSQDAVAYLRGSERGFREHLRTWRKGC
jgi:hypothetical protein